MSFPYFMALMLEEKIIHQEGSLDTEAADSVSISPPVVFLLLNSFPIELILSDPLASTHISMPL